jgi:energy-coupling factor transporter ATP-binding protein EcfA2
VRASRKVSAVSGPQATVPAKVSGKVADGRIAIARLLGVATSTGQGDRLGALGDTGTGKTTLMRALVDAYERQVGGVVVVVDDGGAAGYAGEEREDLGHLAREPVKGARVVLVGNVFAAVSAEPEQGAILAWRLAQRRKKVCLVVDELNDAAKGGWWRKGVERLPAAFTKGRKYGLSVVWTTQQVQDVPREAFNQTSAIACFKLVGLGVERLRERGYLAGMPDGTLEGLPGQDAPASARGVFVLLVRGQSWDGRFYRLSV